MKLNLLAGAVAVAFVAGPATLWAADLQKKVLIIGVDGMQPAAMALAQTPNINALRTNGCSSDRAVTHPVTHSAACWSSMFTGVWGDKHAVNDPGNSFEGQRFALYPNFFRRLETVNTNLNTVAFTRWAPLSTVLGGTDAVTNYGSDAALTTATCNLLTNGNPDVFYTILLDVDSVGHSSGWGSSNYIRAIGIADTQIGQMINALTNRTTYAQEDWLVIVLSDHGNHDGTLQDTRITFHLVSGPSAARGTIWPTPSIVDICATVLTHMGVPIDPAWDLDARVEGLPLPPTRYGTNLIFNGDAEANSGTNYYYPNRGIAWWTDYTSLTLGCYGANSNFPSLTSPGPANRGNNFFFGGTNAGAITISQTIDISDIAADIDDPGVDFELSGWFGGRGSDSDASRLSVRFLNRTSSLVGTNYVGMVSANDRFGATGMLQRSTNGTLPAGTRLVEFLLTANASSGLNDGSADNLAFVLTPKADPPFRIVAFGATNQAWQVEFDSRTNRLYTLERTADFQAWSAVSDPTPGTGDRLVLADPERPNGQAFYRVNCRRP